MQRNSLFVIALVLVPHSRKQISLVKTAATVRHAMQTWLVMIYVDGVYAIFIATQTHHKRFFEFSVFNCLFGNWHQQKKERHATQSTCT